MKVRNRYLSFYGVELSQKNGVGIEPKPNNVFCFSRSFLLRKFYVLSLVLTLVTTFTFIYRNFLLDAKWSNYRMSPLHLGVGVPQIEKKIKPRGDEDTCAP